MTVSRRAVTVRRSAKIKKMGSSANKTSAVSGVRTAPTLSDYIDAVRPTHWIKNIIVFAAPVASMKLTDPPACRHAMLAFVAFCMAASATYLINDVLDRESDAAHPTKRSRPIARGAIRPSVALALALGLIAFAVGFSFLLLGNAVTGVVGFYFLLTLSYSVALKQSVILDVMIVAVGFVLRAWGGALAVGVPPSQWLIACVFTLCLFMGFGKRRCELAMIASPEDVRHHRPTLIRYTPHLLNHLITVSAGIAVITFLLYTVDTSGLQAPFPKRHLFFSMPIVVYGIFRFAMLTETGRFSGPVDIVWRDRPLQLSVVLWGLFALVVAYQKPLLGPDGLGGFFAS